MYPFPTNRVETDSDKPNNDLKHLYKPARRETSNELRKPAVFVIVYTDRDFILKGLEEVPGVLRVYNARR